MSSLPNNSHEVAEEWLARAQWRHVTGVRGLKETGDTKEAVRDFASAAELAIKSVYIGHGTPFPRTYSVWELARECPDRTVDGVLEGYSERWVRGFSRHYLAPYVRARPVPSEDTEECRRFSERILAWAAGIIRT